MTHGEAQALLDAMVAAANAADEREAAIRAANLKTWNTRPPSWVEWPRKVHKAVAAMCVARDAIPRPRVSAQAACDVIWDMHKVAICASTLDRYCRVVLGRRSFARPNEDAI